MSQYRKIKVVAYDRSWPDVFEQLRHVIARALGDIIVRLEHVGSTSVYGLAAKPIIDLDLVIASRSNLDAVITALSVLGYRYEGNQGIEGREAFAREADDIPRDGSGRRWVAHNLYVCVEGASELIRHVAFRDYLRANREAAEAYAELKRELAVRHADDIDGYCDAKTEFITMILGKAARARQRRE